MLPFKLYPNPAKDVVMVQFSQLLQSDVEVVLVDAQGKILLQGEVEIGQQSLLINTITLSHGLYFCEIKGTGMINNTQKFVIIE